MFAVGFLDFFLTALWFALLIAWIALSVQVIVDIFRSQDLSGWGKALWSIFIVLLPFLGVFVYLVARGDKMAERRYKDLEAQDAVTRAYIRDAAGTGSDADSLAALAKLHDSGHLTDEEFERAKQRVLAN